MLHFQGVVLSVVEKSCLKTCQVCSKETNASEPLRRHRKSFLWYLKSESHVDEEKSHVNVAYKLSRQIPGVKMA